MRAIIYALSCKEQEDKISLTDIVTGCNRFGIDNPIPIITKKLAIYGNTDEVSLEFKKAVMRIKDSNKQDEYI